MGASPPYGGFAPIPLTAALNSNGKKHSVTVSVGLISYLSLLLLFLTIAKIYH